MSNIDYIAFIKFGKKEHLEELQHGLIYMKESQYFKDLEYKTRMRGKGDRYDSSKVQRNVPVWINGKRVPNPDYMSFSSYEDSKTPIFCCTCLKENDFLYDYSKKCYVLKDDLFDETTLKQDFGEHFLIIAYPEEFLGRINFYCQLQNIAFRFKEVIYVDYDRKDNYWIKYYTNNLSHFFIKDNWFSRQKEFRFLLANIFTDDDKGFTTITILKGFDDITRIEPVEKLNTIKFYRK